MDKANDAGIPLVTMNSGSADFQKLHAFTHVGQDEFIAGQQAGLKFKELGATKILCPIQEASNIGLQQRCDGAKDTFGNVENLQLSAGLADLTKSESEIQAKLEADSDIDAVFSLNADIATGSALPAVEAVGRDITSAPSTCPATPCRRSRTVRWPSRSTSSSTRRATCRSCCSTSTRSTATCSVAGSRCTPAPAS